MIQCITNIPERKKYQEDMQNLLNTFCRHVSIVTDHDKIGCPRNSVRTIETALSLADDNEWCFIGTDDIIFCNKFKDRLDKVLGKSKTDIVCLNYHYNKSVEKHQDKDRFLGYRQFHFCDIGYMIKKTSATKNLLILIKQKLKKAEEELISNGASYIHIDHLIGYVLIKNNIPWEILTKTLTTHNLQIPSSLGHAFMNGQQGFIDKNKGD